MSESSLRKILGVIEEQWVVGRRPNGRSLSRSEHHSLRQLLCVDRSSPPSRRRRFCFRECEPTRIKIEPKKVAECIVGYPVITTVFALDDQSVEIAGGGIFCLGPADWAVHF